MRRKATILDVLREAQEQSAPTLPDPSPTPEAPEATGEGEAPEAEVAPLRRTDLAEAEAVPVGQGRPLGEGVAAWMEKREPKYEGK